MVTIDYTGLRLTGALRINRLTALELHVGVNEHGWAAVEGEAGENALEQLQGAVAGREQVIMVRDETGAEQPLFAGVIRSAGLITYGGYNRFRIELQSGTIQMDQVKRSRSFQDVAQTYSQVAQRVASGYEDGAVIPTVGLDKPLEAPVIQYRETDWEFLKRLASWCGGVVVPETHYAYPRIWFGFPDRAFTCTFPEDCYTSGISQRYYELGGPAAGNRRADFFYYDVPSSQMCDLGWYTVFRGQEFLICEKWAKLERGELLFTYRLGKPGLGYGRKEYNDKISGMTILGEVLSTKRETVCLKLDIDEGWAPGGPYPYTWRPETGNMMYCMPQVGTRVSLYFPSCDEQAAIAVNCVRTNGSSCARMSDPSRRSFVTEHGKEMNLYPREMSFLGGANGTVKLEDETGITFSTDKKIRIIANQSILVNGQTLAVSAPAGELVLAKGNILTGEIETTAVQSNQYDLLAASFTHMEGQVFISFEAYSDAPEEGGFSWSGLVQFVLGAVAVVAVVSAIVSSGIGIFILGGVVLGAIEGAVRGYTTGLEQGLSGKELWDRVKLNALAGAIQGGVEGVLIGLATKPLIKGMLIADRITFQMTGVSIIDQALTHLLPPILAALPKDFFASTVEAIFPDDSMEKFLDDLTGGVLTDITREGMMPRLFYIFGFFQDEDGDYHARQDAVQIYFGYNKLYDALFDIGTDMAVDRLEFTHEGEEYALWFWKGDYLNLGSGGELGIYQRYGDTDHYIADRDLALPMTLVLKDKDGNVIIDYAPDDPQWWITGFDPSVPDLEANELTAYYTIDLSGDPQMYQDIKDTYNGDGTDSSETRWEFHNDSYIIDVYF